MCQATNSFVFNHRVKYVEGSITSCYLQSRACGLYTPGIPADFSFSEPLPGHFPLTHHTVEPSKGGKILTGIIPNDEWS